MTPRREPVIFVVSDGRGNTCEQLLRAALVQYEGKKLRVERRGHIRTGKQVRKVVEDAAAAQAIIFYTLVSEKTRLAIRASADELLVPIVDLFGSAFSALNDLFGVKPRSRPGLYYDSEQEHFDRIDAIDYTLKHDDGQRAHELADAHVVLVGVSRASKSSTCFYLAYQGIRAANVPLIPGVEPLPELLDLDPELVIGLTVNVLRLRTVRQARAAALGLQGGGSYLDKRALAREVRDANLTMARYDWRTVDVSYRAIEEIAKEIIELRGLKPKKPR